MPLGGWFFQNRRHSGKIGDKGQKLRRTMAFCGEFWGGMHTATYSAETKDRRGVVMKCLAAQCRLPMIGTPDKVQTLHALLSSLPPCTYLLLSTSHVAHSSCAPFRGSEAALHAPSLFFLHPSH